MTSSNIKKTECQPLKNTQSNVFQYYPSVLAHKKEMVQHHSRVFCDPKTALQEDRDSDSIHG